MQDADGAASMPVAPVGDWSGPIGDAGEFTASGALLDRRFAHRIDISANRIIIGSPDAGSGATIQGADRRFVFDRGNNAPNDGEGAAAAATMTIV